MCHVSHITCHMSHVVCHMSHVVFLYIYIFYKVVRLVGGGSVINRATLSIFLVRTILKKIHLNDPKTRKTWTWYMTLQKTTGYLDHYPSRYTKSQWGWESTWKSIWPNLRRSISIEYNALFYIIICASFTTRALMQCFLSRGNVAIKRPHLKTFTSPIRGTKHVRNALLDWIQSLFRSFVY